MGNCEIKVKRSGEEELFHSDTFLGDEFSDEMYHWKYIKRERKNGKWVYYYDTTELDKYDKGTTSVSKSMDASGNTSGTTKIGYRKHDGLFDSETTIQSVGSKDKTVYKYQGKLSRAQAKAEKKIYDTFCSGARKKQKANSLRNAAAKGRNAVRKFLKIR